MSAKQTTSGPLTVFDILKADAQIEQISSSDLDSEVYKAAKEEAKRQHSEIMQFNEIDHDQLRLVVQL